MALLNIRPRLKQITTVILGHTNAGDSLKKSFNSAYSYSFDGVYVGNKNRLTNFGMYGDPIIGVNPMSLNWAYNSTSVKTFNVTCNHSSWKFYSGIDTSGWLISVWDGDNLVKLGDYSAVTLWPNDSTVSINPITTNLSNDDSYCVAYACTYDDTLVVDANCIADQAFLPIPPTFTFESDDITLLNTSATWSIGSSAITLTWTPSAMPTSPHINYIYITIPGPISLLSSSRANCCNGDANNTIAFTLSENVQYNTNYLVTIDYSELK